MRYRLKSNPWFAAFVPLVLAVCGCADASYNVAAFESATTSSALDTLIEEPSGKANAVGPIEIARILSADEMQGRMAGEASAAKARVFIEKQLAARGLSSINQGFTFENADGEQKPGVNVIARIKGKSSEQVMVVTAHYDHVGVMGGEIFNGASDNATGVAGAFAVADHFLKHPPEHDIVLAFLDAEEIGLYGAIALLDQGLPGGGRIAFNLNLDMITAYEKDTLFASGSYHYPQLVPVIEKVAKTASISVKMGHDRPEDGVDDWTLLSDHGPFHRENIPFLYFGVEDHKFYHQPGDTFETLPQDFFAGALDVIVMTSEAADDMLPQLSNKAK